MEIGIISTAEDLLAYNLPACSIPADQLIFENDSFARIIMDSPSCWKAVLYRGDIGGAVLDVFDEWGDKRYYTPGIFSFSLGLANFEDLCDFVLSGAGSIEEWVWEHDFPAV